MTRKRTRNNKSMVERYQGALAFAVWSTESWRVRAADELGPEAMNCLCECLRKTGCNVVQESWRRIEIWQREGLKLKSFASEISLDEVDNLTIRGWWRNVFEIIKNFLCILARGLKRKTSTDLAARGSFIKGHTLSTKVLSSGYRCATLTVCSNCKKLRDPHGKHQWDDETHRPRAKNIRRTPRLFWWQSGLRR